MGNKEYQAFGTLHRPLWLLPSMTWNSTQVHSTSTNGSTDLTDPCCFERRSQRKRDFV